MFFLTAAVLFFGVAAAPAADIHPADLREVVPGIHLAHNGELVKLSVDDPYGRITIGKFTVQREGMLAGLFNENGQRIESLKIGNDGTFTFPSGLVEAEGAEDLLVGVGGEPRVVKNLVAFSDLPTGQQPIAGKILLYPATSEILSTQPVRLGVLMAGRLDLELYLNGKRYDWGLLAVQEGRLASGAVIYTATKPLPLELGKNEIRLIGRNDIGILSRTVVYDVTFVRR